MRTLSNLSPFGNLSHSVFSSVDLFLRRRSPMNTTGSVAGPSYKNCDVNICGKLHFENVLSPLLEFIDLKERSPCGREDEP